LFGGLPITDASPSTYTGRCIEVITKARFLLGIRLDQYSPDRENWPEYETFNGLVSESMLLSVRAIFRNSMEIFSYAQQYGSEWAPSDEEGISVDYAHSPDQIPNQVIYFARQSIGFDSSTPNHVIFAVLAIVQVKDALDDCISQGEKAPKPLASGQAFLAEAQRLKLEESHQTELQTLEPFIKTGRKVREGMEQGRKESARIRSQEVEEDKQIWQAMAKRAWKENPGWTVLQMAEHIQARLVDSDDYFKPPSIGTVKNALKGVKAKVFPPRR
ncbi:MAG: hypothetical protein HQL68_03470, partial [Magnetococcales bacterium]|nr:hypothetical protein [Magnetococcales bacterium]